jgi:ABC-2 type transport system permease protein
MAAAYTAIGLFVSSRTDNQLVALILTVLLGGLLYLVGVSVVTDFVHGTPAEILRAIGTGSRFESIERGVIDLRDLAYYLSLTALFLVLNAISLDSKRWSRGQSTEGYRRSIKLTSLLLALNLVALNVWVYPLNGLRLDLTAQHEYSLSQPTRDLVGNLPEPLLIRGYFSSDEKMHRLLRPLVPQVKDLLREYEIAGRGKVMIDVVDPLKDPDKEAEATQTYGIQPTPLQDFGRYETSVVSTYFDLLVRYGDQYTTLGFRDLIEVESRRDGSVDVRLRNLEYDLTRAIKKVVYGFQSVDAVLAAMSGPVKLTLFVTPDTLPEPLKTAPQTIQKVATELQTKSNGKLSFETINPDAPGSPVNRQALYNTYKLRPLAVSLFSDQSYYLDMVLQVGDPSTGSGQVKSQLIYPSGEMNEANVRTAIEAGLKRASTGFLKVVGLWHPSEQATPNVFGQMQSPLATWSSLRQQLGQDYTVRQVDLTAGEVPADVDVLVVIAPQQMDDKARYAIDQYLMRGGAVVIATSSFALALDEYQGNLALQPVENGLAEMLENYGIRVEKSLVMDPQNEPFPVQVDRKVGNYTVQEIQAINYPFFVDVRSDGMDRTSPIVANLPAITLNWASPLTVDQEKNKERQVNVLLKSSPNSWLRTTPDIQPNLQQYPNVGFPVEGDKGARPLAVAVRGSFESYFKTGGATDTSKAPVTSPVTSTATIEASPDTARLVVIGSGEFLDDIVFQISSSLTQDRYLNSLQFLQNAVDWSVEDLDLLGIRARGSSARVLRPMTDTQKTFWEWLNAGVALLALLGIGVTWNLRRRNERPMELVPVTKEVGKQQ